MLELINISAADVCEANKGLLARYTANQLVNADGYIDVDKINNIEDRKDFLEQFYENETLNIQYIKGSYQKQKYKAKHTTMLLIAAFTLIAAGYFLAPLFIASAIILPIIPVLLVGIAIIALTKFYLNTRLDAIETNKLQAQAFFDKIMANKGSNINEVEVNDAVNGSTQELKETIKETTLEVTKALSKKVDMLAENTQSFFIAHSKSSPEDTVDAFHLREGAPNHS